MKKAYLAIGTHNHQPVGNFPEVFERAYQESYKPFMETMEKRPNFKWSLHLSGILWDFMVDKHPEYIAKVSEMVRAGRLELLSGGYYEPILAVIPDADKKGQVAKLNKFLKDTFKYDSTGVWLTERIWEPHMPRPLSESGVQYTVIDDSHFAASGMDVENLRGYFLTEEQGMPLSVFPISQRLRYYMPFKPPHYTIDYMKSFLNNYDNPLFVMADDGEKFGHWPGTYKHVYQDGWLEQFLNEVEKHDWIETITFSEYREKLRPVGRVYIPTASYFEMSEGSLLESSQESFEHVVKEFEHRDDVKRYLKGGFWRNFLTKYSESNNMHKKMLYVSSKINSKLNGKPAGGSLSAAVDSLYAAQCNCAYWHGVFGGLYLPHLRNAVYSEIINAENNCEPDADSRAWKETDFNVDGRNELLFESKKQNVYVSPSKGGAIFEWDIKGKRLNLLNVLTRRKEAYHKKLVEFNRNKQEASAGAASIHDVVKVKEDNLDKYLNYDWYEKLSLIDHFIHPDTKFENFRRCQYGEQGDFVFGEYDALRKNSLLSLSRNGKVWFEDKHIDISLSKEIEPGPEGIKVRYKIKNNSKIEVALRFAPEFNFSFSSNNADTDGEVKQASQWAPKDSHFGG